MSAIVKTGMRIYTLYNVMAVDKVLNGINQEKRLSCVTWLLYLGNLAIIGYLMWINVNATNLVCEGFDARIFIEKMQYAPENPVNSGLTALFFFLLLSMLELLRHRHCNIWFRNENSDFILFFVYAALCTAIMYCLNMGCKGLIFIPATHALTRIPGKVKKISALFISLVLYILLDNNIAAFVIRLVPPDTYIQYYSAAWKLRLITIRTLLFSSNDVIFITVIVIYIQIQTNETRRIRELNAKLNASLQSLKDANMQLARYAQEREEIAKLRERNRLAREIHDTMGHTLTGIELGLKACLCLPHSHIDEIFTQISKVEELARKGAHDIRLSLKALRPDALQRYSLVPALQTLVMQMNSCTKSKTFLTIEDAMPEIQAQQEELIYRIIQESITNAAGHGEATDIEIRIGNDGSTLYISVCDNGRGTDKLVPGFGLTNIRERVEFFKGSIRIITAEGKGFELHISLPLMRRTGND